MARILVIDDDPDVVEACRLFLEKDKHTVIAAYSRTEGMEAVANHKPDLLVLDVIMEQPDDGIAMAQDLRRTGFNGPILMMTSLSKVTGLSYSRDDDTVPVDAFLEKPVDAATLTSKVKDLLNEKGQ